MTRWRDGRTVVVMSTTEPEYDSDPHNVPESAFDRWIHMLENLRDWINRRPVNFVLKCDTEDTVDCLIEELKDLQNAELEGASDAEGDAT